MAGGDTISVAKYYWNWGNHHNYPTRVYLSGVDITSQLLPLINWLQLEQVMQSMGFDLSEVPGMKLLGDLVVRF